MDIQPDVEMKKSSGFWRWEGVNPRDILEEKAFPNFRVTKK